MNKIFIAGSSGYIGNILCNNFMNKYKLVPLRRNSNIYKKSKDKSNILIYAAGNKNIQECENDFNLAIDSNFDYLKFITHELDDPFVIYLSTDYVFNGVDGNYKINHMPSADTNYGKSKVMAEEWLKNNYKGKKHILRVSAVCSKNSSFIRYLINESKKECNEVSVAADSYFSPTPINLFCSCIDFLIDKKLEGLSHLSGPRISRAEFANLISKIFDLKIKLINQSYKNINKNLRPDLSLVNSFLDFKDYSDEKFFKLLHRVYNCGYELSDFSEKIEFIE